MKALYPLPPEVDAEIKVLFPHFANRAIAERLGIEEKAVISAGKRLHLLKTKECKANQPNATTWTPEMIQFLKDNFYTSTNPWLADQLGLKLTVVRNKTRELGLQHFPMRYWTGEQITFLKDHYKIIGDTEIAEKLQELFPREKRWTRKHVHKKRYYLNLYRNQEELKAIIAEHSKPGGRSYTILKNSGVITLNDRYIANFISKDPAVKDELLKHPELIDLKRQQVLLNRALKGGRNGK